MSALISNPVVRSILRGVLVWAPLWISTTVLFGVLGLGYVLLLKQDSFLASQALLVRDEATGAVMRLGRFQSQAEMKAAQETILEMAKSQQVVHDALEAIHPKGEGFSWFQWGGEYASKEMVEEVAKSISVHAPKGTEFGVTEVIYLDVKANSKDEAMRMSVALTDALESRLQQIRKARADGVLAELTLARDAAKIELAKSTAKLHEIENAAGSDLSDLRGMTDTVAGAATSRAELDQTKSELRQAELNRQSLLADRDMLIRATKDPSSFIVAPGTVLSSQPGLKRLREGLVDAQLAGSQLTGKFTEAHPSVIASQSSQSSIVSRFLQELKASIAGVESDLALVDGRINRLESQKSALQERLAKLADSRAPYANLLSEVKSKVSILEAAEKELAEVQAARDSSVSTSLLTRLDEPTVSDRPTGPGKTTITGLCTIAGCVFGLGIVFVITPLDAGPTFGRRSVDRVRGRRDADIGQPHRETAFDSPNASIAQAPIGLELGGIEPGLDKQLGGAPLPSQNPMPEGYQSIAKHRPIGSAKPTAPTAVRTVSKGELETKLLDQTFQELANLQALKPSNRTEELNLNMKVQELKEFLSRQGVSNVPQLASTQDELPKMKPRPTKGA